MFSHLALTRRKVSVAVLALTALSVITPHMQAATEVSASTTIGLELLGRANSGVGNAGSEIAAFDKD